MWLTTIQPQLATAEAGAFLLQPQAVLRQVALIQPQPQTQSQMFGMLLFATTAQIPRALLQAKVRETMVRRLWLDLLEAAVIMAAVEVLAMEQPAQVLELKTRC